MRRDTELPPLGPASICWPGFRLDFAAGDLFDATGRPAGLRAQALKVLLVLGEHAGQVVSKDELMRRVWGDVVVTEDSLVQAIGDIRRVLGDDDHQRVKTVSRRGYLLAGESLTAAADSARALEVRGIGPGGAALAARTPRRWTSWHAWVAFAVLIVLAAAGWLGMSNLRSDGVPLRSMAILPFESAGPGAADDWFVDALTDELAVKLSRWQDIRLMGQRSMRGYKGRQADPRAVAAELGVRYVLTGTARRDGSRVRLNLTLVDGPSGRAAWADQFDFDRAELERSLGDIAGGLARVLLVQIGAAIGTQLPALSSDAVEADDLAMQGFSVLLRGIDPAGFREALALFEAAASRDTRSIRALAGLSLSNSMSVIFNFTADRRAAISAAEQAQARAEALDPHHLLTLLGRASLANMKADWDGLLAVSQTLIRHYPNEASAHHHRCSALLRLGRFEPSIEACERALRISPRDSRAPIWRGLIGMNQFMLGRWAEAADSARPIAGANRNVPFYGLLLAAALAEAGQRDEAARLVGEFRDRHPDWTAARIAETWPSANADFVAGRERVAQRVRELGLP